MFTGIVETWGAIAACGGGKLAVVSKRPLKGISVGESVSVDGVCLTVDRIAGRKMAFRLLPETVRVSTLKSLQVGDSVNLERALRLGSRLGGHLLLGHVDGKGRIVERIPSGDTLTLQIQVPSALTRTLVPKGPIAVDGVSLTLDPKIELGRIRVHLIPHTALSTTLGKKPVGGWVNLELDLVAKYLHRMI